MGEAGAARHQTETEAVLTRPTKEVHVDLLQQVNHKGVHLGEQPNKKYDREAASETYKDKEFSVTSISCYQPLEAST